MAASTVMQSVPVRVSATLRDVADLAGVSMSTVSRVLTGKGGVAPVTRKRIEGALHQLDYVSDVSARSLRGNRSMTYALLIDDLGSTFFSELAESLTHRALEQGCTLMIVTTQKTYEREREIIAEMRARRVDGVFVVPATGDEAGERARRNIGLPTVYLERFPPGAAADVVTFDYYQAGLEQVEHLWGQGHRRIGFIGGNVAEDPGMRRLAAFRDGLRAHGVEVDPELQSVNHVTSADARQATEELMALADPPTALVVTIALFVRGVLDAFVERGWRLPVASYEAIDTPLLTPVPLMVTHADIDELAHRAGDLLQTRIAEGPGPARTVILATRTDLYTPL